MASARLAAAAVWWEEEEGSAAMRTRDGVVGDRRWRGDGGTNAWAVWLRRATARTRTRRQGQVVPAAARAAAGCCCRVRAAAVAVIVPLRRMIDQSESLSVGRASEAAAGPVGRFIKGFDFIYVASGY